MVEIWKMSLRKIIAAAFLSALLLIFVYFLLDHEIVPEILRTILTSIFVITGNTIPI